MKRIAYGKLGRVVEVDPAKWGESGGDNEPPVLLLTLADRHPDVEWVAVGKNSGWTPPRANITNPWLEWGPQLKMKADATVEERIARHDAVTMAAFTDFDGVVLWLGQHGTSNSPIPKVDDRPTLTSPQMSFVAYSAFLLRGINYWRKHDPLGREEVWLLPDARNYLKGRDLKWPRRHNILCQFNWQREEWCERYGDTRSPKECGFGGDVVVDNGKWRSTDHYAASSLELVGIPDPKALVDLPPWEERSHFGILINEARGYGMRPELTRLHAMQHYVKPLDPAWAYGTWPQASLDKLGMSIKPIPYGEIFEHMAHTKSTFTTPSSGSGWATAKPWEAFGTGTICFFHPSYDTQGHIIPTLDQLEHGDPYEDEIATLARWLRVRNPNELAARVAAVHTSRETYEWLAWAQYKLLQSELAAKRCVTTIERRLGL